MEHDENNIPFFKRILVQVPCYILMGGGVPYQLNKLNFSNSTVDSWNPASQLRLVVYPIIYKVLAPSQVGFLAGFLNHQQYVGGGGVHKTLEKTTMKLPTREAIYLVKLVAGPTSRRKTKIPKWYDCKRNGTPAK